MTKKHKNDADPEYKKDCARLASLMYWNVEKRERQLEKAEQTLREFMETHPIDLALYVKMTSPAKEVNIERYIANEEE